jgi:hypothetical protein
MSNVSAFVASIAHSKSAYQNFYAVLKFYVSNVFYLGRPRRRWVDNIKIDLREIGWDGMDWIELAQTRDQWRALVNTVMNLRVP